jgi:Flp pilus assembly protein TadB
MVIRVKSESFDKLLHGILEQAVRIDNKTINAEDVTSEFVDAEARLKSKKEAEEQFALILKKANTINDILAVQEQLRAIREEIESYQGKLKYLNDKVNYCTVNIKFYEKSNYIPSSESGFFYRVSKAFATGWQGVVAFFIGLIYLWPLLLIALLTLYFIRRMVRSRKARKLEKK